MQLPFNIKFNTNNKKDALRLALQSATAAILAFVIIKSIESKEVFLCVLSAVFIVEPSIGNTISQAKSRVVATIVGSIIGFTISTIIPSNVGTAISLGVSMLVINFITGFKKSWRYGIVAALAIALASESGILNVTIDRLIAIAIGVCVGTLVTFIIWPDKSEDRAKRYMKEALKAANNRFNSAIANTKQKDNEDGSKHASLFHKYINLAEDMTENVRFSDSDNLKSRIKYIRTLYNSIIIIHRVGQESQTNVIDETSNIEKDTEKIKALVNTILENLSKGKEIDDSTSKDFFETIKDLIENVKISEEDTSVNILRHTFIFGLTEMKQSMKTLIELYSN